MSDSRQPASVIEVVPSYFFLAFLLAFFKPMVSINGAAPFKVAWGRTPVPVPPGRYQVEVWVPYLFFTTMGKNGIIVDVPAGGAVRVAWRAPFVAFARGSIQAVPLGPVDPSFTGALGGAAGYSAGSGAPPGGPFATAAATVPGAAPAGWHADPSGRHQQRYYDGSGWTEHVVDGGVQATDPLT